MRQFGMGSDEILQKVNQGNNNICSLINSLMQNTAQFKQNYTAIQRYLDSIMFMLDNTLKTDIYIVMIEALLQNGIIQLINQIVFISTANFQTQSDFFRMHQSCVMILKLLVLNSNDLCFDRIEQQKNKHIQNSAQQMHIHTILINMLYQCQTLKLLQSQEGYNLICIMLVDTLHLICKHKKTLKRIQRDSDITFALTFLSYSLESFPQLNTNNNGYNNSQNSLINYIAVIIRNLINGQSLVQSNKMAIYTMLSPLAIMLLLKGLSLKCYENILCCIQLMTSHSIKANEEVIIDILDKNFVQRILHFIQEDNPSVLFKIALDIISNVSFVDDVHTLFILDNGVLDVFTQILKTSNNEDVRKDICFVLSNYALTQKQHINLFYQKGTFSCFVDLIRCNDTINVKNECLICIENCMITLSCKNEDINFDLADDQIDNLIEQTYVKTEQIVYQSNLIDVIIEELKMQLQSALNLHYIIKLMGVIIAIFKVSPIVPSDGGTNVFYNRFVLSDGIKILEQYQNYCDFQNLTDPVVAQIMELVKLRIKAIMSIPQQIQQNYYLSQESDESSFNNTEMIF